MASKTPTSPSKTSASDGKSGKSSGKKGKEKGKNFQKFDTKKYPQPKDPNEVPYMSDNEKERVNEAFKMDETDMRSTTMKPEVSFDTWIYDEFCFNHSKNISIFLVNGQKRTNFMTRRE